MDKIITKSYNAHIKNIPIWELFMVKNVINDNKSKQLYKPQEINMFFSNTLKESIEFIERNQLYDVSLWNNFVEVFRAHKDGCGDWFVSWRSEYWGKMMRGASMIVRYTKNKEIYDILENSVRDILSTQDEFGRISGYSVEEEFTRWDLWGRKYVMLGMMYFLEICEDNELCNEIINSMRKQAEYIIERIGPEKLDIRQCSKHWEGLNSCSILEPIVRLYKLTGDKKYFEFAEYIISTGFILSDNLIELAYNNVSPYNYPVAKAYEMLSCFEGLLHFYYITGIQKYKTAIINLGANIIKNELSIIGCAGCTNELFDNATVNQTRTDFTGINQETCVTITWMKFASQLLELTGDPVYADMIEQSFYNAFRGSFNTMRVPIKRNDLSSFAQILPFDSYSPLIANKRGRITAGANVLLNNTFYGCCACIGAAGAGLIPEIALMNADNKIVINYYEKGVISAVSPQNSPVKFIVDTEYPYNGTVKIKLELEKSEAFDIAFRIPGWCDNATVSYNEKVESFAPGYATISALWNNSDEILIEMPMKVKRVLPSKDAINSDVFAAYTYGPLVLAADKRLTDPEQALNIVCDEAGFVNAKETTCTEIKEAHICFEVPLESGEKVKLIDYASAGKTCSDESRCSVWLKKQA